MSNSPMSRCSDCGRLIDESLSLPVEDRQPCPDCGSMARTVVLAVEDAIRVRASVTAAVISISGTGANSSAGSAELEVRPRRTEIDDLPTEVIANTLSVTINLAEASENDQWPMDVRMLGHQGEMRIDTLDNGLVDLALWIRDRALMWRDKIRGNARLRLPRDNGTQNPTTATEWAPGERKFSE